MNTNTGTSGNYKLINILNLDENSYVRNIPDSKYFEHIFCIYGKEGGLILCHYSKDAKNKFINILENEVLIPLYKKIEKRIIINQKLLETEDIIQKFSKKIDISVKVFLFYNF